jgi:hypothetical protein
MLDIRPKSLVGIEGLTDRPPRSRKMALTRPSTCRTVSGGCVQATPT